MKLILNNVRLAFPEIWKPTAFEEGQALKYRATFLIPKGSTVDKQVQAAIKAVMVEGFADKAVIMTKTFSGDPTKWAYRDGDLKDGYDGYAGNMALTANNAKRPVILNTDKTPLTEQDGKPYAGSYVNASVDLWPQTKNNKGLRASLLAIQFLKDGDAFTPGAVADENDFENLSDQGEEQSVA